MNYEVKPGDVKHQMRQDEIIRNAVRILIELQQAKEQWLTRPQFQLGLCNSRAGKALKFLYVNGFIESRWANYAGEVMKEYRALQPGPKSMLPPQDEVHPNGGN